MIEKVLLDKKIIMTETLEKILVFNFKHPVTITLIMNQDQDAINADISMVKNYWDIVRINNIREAISYNSITCRLNRVAPPRQ